MKYIFMVLAFILLAPIITMGQHFTKKDFVNTGWAISNEDSNFYKTDTTRLIRVVLSENFPPGTDMDLYQFFKKNNYFQFFLKSRGRMKFGFYDISEGNVTSKVGKHKWDFDEASQTLFLYFKKKVIVSFVIKGVNDTETKSIYYTDTNPVKTKELVVIKSKADYFISVFKQ